MAVAVDELTAADDARCGAALFIEFRDPVGAESAVEIPNEKNDSNNRCNRKPRHHDGSPLVDWESDTVGPLSQGVSSVSLACSVAIRRLSTLVSCPRGR